MKNIDQNDGIPFARVKTTAEIGVLFKTNNNKIVTEMIVELPEAELLCFSCLTFRRVWYH